MRHAGSLALALVLGPLIWLLAGYGLSTYAGDPAGVRDLHTDAVLALVGLLLAGGLYAALAMARLSPVGPAVAGAAFIGLAGWHAFAPESYAATLPQVGDGGVPPAAGGYGLLLGVPLLAALAFPDRWRRRPAPAGGRPSLPVSGYWKSPQTPAAAQGEETTILPAPAGQDERTQRVNATAGTAGTTVLISAGPAEETTTVIRPDEGQHLTDEPTTVLAGRAPIDETTTVIARDDSPAPPDEQTTVIARGEPDTGTDERTVVIPHQPDRASTDDTTTVIARDDRRGAADPDVTRPI